MFGILKPAPHAKRIADQAVVKKNYRYWKLRTLFGMYGGYTVFYFTRKNLPIAIPAMTEQLGISMTGLGWVLTISSLAYGMSKFTSGMVSDRSNPRYFMAFGLMLTGLLNVLFGLSSSILAFALIWGLNGWFQGCGWPPCSRLLTHWYGKKERARWWAVWNTSHNLGGFLIPLITLWCITSFSSWRYALYIPGFFAMLTGIYLLVMLRCTPQSVGLPSIEEFEGEAVAQGDVDDQNEERELTTKEILFKYVLSNRYIWLLAFAYFFLYFVRQAINDWSLVYLTSQKGYKMTSAGFCVALFEVGGLFGSLASGWLSDVVFRGKRGPVSVLFAVAVVASVGFFWALPEGQMVAAASAMFLTGFFVFGPQMLIGVAAAELSHKKACATATGFAGFFAYMGAAAAGGPIVQVAQKMGWGAFFAIVAASGVCVVFLLLPLWSKTQQQMDEPQEEAEAELAAS